MEIATTKHIRKTASPIQKMSKPKKLIAFGWYGGKFSHLDWLLPKLPDCLHYCEPFAGSGAVLLNKAPSSVETYNDIEGDDTYSGRFYDEKYVELFVHKYKLPCNPKEIAEGFTTVSDSDVLADINDLTKIF